MKAAKPLNNASAKYPPTIILADTLQIKFQMFSNIPTLYTPLSTSQ